jgi:hypothetical protein
MYGVSMMARGEPDYVDQVPRREAYEKAHPDVKITYHDGWWQAVIPEEAGETVVSRYELKALLDKLEALGGGPAAPGDSG